MAEYLPQFQRIIVNCYTAVLERLSYKRGKAYVTMSQVIMGNGGFTIIIA